MVRTFIALSLVMTILGFSPQPIRAQSDCTEMVYGASMNGSLDSIDVTEDFEDIYCFFGVAGETVTITMDITSGTIDPLLFVQIPDGTVVADNENRPDGVTNSTITFTLSVTDWYTIRATQYPYGGGFGSGGYILSLNSSTNSTDNGNTDTDGGVELSGNVCGPSFGDPRLDYLVNEKVDVDGELTSSDPWAYYYFEARAGEIFRITLSSSDFDAYLTLYDGSEIVRQNDNMESGSTDSQIVYDLNHDGIYCIEASSFQNQDMGSFTLSLEYLSTEATETALDGGSNTDGNICGPSTDEPPLSFTTPVDGELTSDVPQVYYYFEYFEDRRVEITLTSSDFDTYLTLYDGSEIVTENIVAENDDKKRGSTDSQIEYDLVHDGIYCIEVRSFQNTGTGSFTISIEDLGSAINRDSVYNTGCYVIELATPAYSYDIGNLDEICFFAVEGYTYGVWMVATSNNLDTSLTVWEYVEGERVVIEENNDA